MVMLMTTILIRDDFLGSSAAARKLGISPRYLLQLADRGTIPCVRTPVGRLFAPEDLEKAAQERESRVAA